MRTCDICHCEKEDGDIAWDEVQACFSCVDKLKVNRKKVECKHFQEESKFSKLYSELLHMNEKNQLCLLDNEDPRYDILSDIRFCPFCGVELK